MTTWEAAERSNGNKTKFLNYLTNNGNIQLSPEELREAEKSFSFYNNFEKQTGNKFTSFVKNTSGGRSSDILSSSLKSENLTGGLDKSIDLVKNMFANGLNGGQILSASLDAIQQGFVTYNQKNVSLYEVINENIGMSGKLAEDFKNEIMGSWPYAEKLGISFEELRGGLNDIVVSSGKFKILDTETINNMSFASKFITNGISGFSNLAKETEKYSLGINDTSREIVKMMKDSIELGLNYKKVIDGVQNSIGKLNLYGFKNGIQGLKEMSQKSIEFRMEMESAFSVADKVWSPEGAIDLTANLQVLGGAIGDLNDPLKLMYMATNNVEGLQESLINAARGLAVYNQEQGRFEITGANLRRAKDMTDALGISMGELQKISIAAAERASASSELMASGLDMDDKDREFLTNLARMEGGRMVISIPENLRDKIEGVENGQVDLSTITQNQLKALIKYRDEIKEMSPKEIQQNQVNLLTNLNRNVAYIASALALQLGKTGSKIINEELLESFGVSSKTVKDDVSKSTDKLHQDITGAGNKLRNWIDGSGKKFNEYRSNITDNFNGGNKNNIDLTKQLQSESNKKSESESKNKEVTTNQNVTVTVRSGGPITDVMARELLKMPEFAREDIGSYLFFNR